MMAKVNKAYKTLKVCSSQLLKDVLGVVNGAHLLMLLCCLLILPGLSHADAGEANLQQARQYLQKQEFPQAYDTLYELFKADPGNPEINFLLGRAAFENKDYEVALMAFERVLVIDPKADRVKLELARCLYNLGSLEAARQYFEEVLATNPPRNVRDNIQRYLKAIKAKTREHFFSGRLSVGVDFNDNANVAPTSAEIDIITVFGYVLPVRVDRPVKDQIYTSTLNFNYLYKPLDSALAWKVSGINYNAVYRDVQNLDVNLFDLKAGLGLQGKRIGWECYALAGKLDVDYRRYQQSLGGGIGLNTAVNDVIQLNMNAKYKKKDYIDASERDADNFSIALAPVLSSGPNRISASLGWELEHADEDINSYNRENAIITYERQFSYGLACGLAYWYQRTDYDDESALFDKKRSDDVQYFITSLSKGVWHAKDGNMALIVNAGYTYVRADSNIELYEFTQNIVSSSLSFAF